MAARRLALTADRSIADELAGWGKVALVTTTGRTTGRPAVTAVGFVARGDSLLIAAGADTADWALNLQADARCRASIGDATHDYVAHRLEGADHAAAVTALILKYGTPAEGLGRGPAFRLTPAG